MRAEFADQSGFAIGGAKSKKLLAENLHAHLRPIPFGYFTRQQDRHPVTPQQITHASTRTGSYQRFGHLLFHSLRSLLIGLSWRGRPHSFGLKSILANIRVTGRDGTAEFNPPLRSQT